MKSEGSAYARDKHEHEEYPDQDEHKYEPPPDPGHDDCDPHLIDCLKCTAMGVAAQAAYNAATQPDIDAARTTYDQARTAYRAQRSDHALEVQDLRHQIKHLVERIKCLIKQRHVVTCIDEAYETVVAQLEECGGPWGCCADDECDFDTACDDLADAELDDRIAAYQKIIEKYQAHIDRARDCFARLSAEPTALAARVVAAKAAIDRVNAALAADPATTDLKRVYAEALVAKRDLDRIWNGFDDTNAFVDCLCRALTCWTKGWAAVSVLTGKKAVAECENAARTKRCDDLGTKTVEEILAIYDKICGQPCYAEPDDTSQDDTQTSSTC
ncbi:MAG: hypothetical protein ACRDRC_07145 [Pseudonocardiaceae bacterium]